MKYRLAVFTILFMCSILLVNASDQRLIELSKNIRCVTCGGQSIEDSPSDFAREIRISLTQQISQGKSDADIFETLRQQFGDDILFAPPFKKHTALLWAFPGIMLMLSIFLRLYRYYRSKRSGA